MRGNMRVNGNKPGLEKFLSGYLHVDDCCHHEAEIPARRTIFGFCGKHLCNNAAPRRLSNAVMGLGFGSLRTRGSVASSSGMWDGCVRELVAKLQRHKLLSG